MLPEEAMLKRYGLVTELDKVRHGQAESRERERERERAQYMWGTVGGHVGKSEGVMLSCHLPERRRGA